MPLKKFLTIALLAFRLRAYGGPLNMENQNHPCGGKEKMKAIGTETAAVGATGKETQTGT